MSVAHHPSYSRVRNLIHGSKIIALLGADMLFVLGGID